MFRGQRSCKLRVQRIFETDKHHRLCHAAGSYDRRSQLRKLKTRLGHRFGREYIVVRVRYGVSVARFAQ